MPFGYGEGDATREEEEEERAFFSLSAPSLRQELVGEREGRPFHVLFLVLKGVVKKEKGRRGRQRENGKKSVPPPPPRLSLPEADTCRRNKVNAAPGKEMLQY